VSGDQSGRYYRPLLSADPARPPEAVRFAQGSQWFTHVEVLQRGAASEVVAAAQMPAAALSALLAERSSLGGAGRPRIMGIINTTPDSFSDGGIHEAASDAIAAGLAMAQAGADILDIGGESTRPGAGSVSVAEEIRRTVPVIESLRARGYAGTLSIDTRKASVARAALAAGADMINDVSGFTYDPALADVAAQAGVPVCAMHGPVDPAIMQDNPRYGNVVLDVYDFLEARSAALERHGIARARIILDPGIGFAKTQAHNLALLARLSLFHTLGLPVMLGASRKRFIGTIARVPEPRARVPGSVAVALAGVAQGVQIVRVHDVAQTAQAIALWRASVAGDWNE
jgi:dihydropteroate synthase